MATKKARPAAPKRPKASRKTTTHTTPHTTTPTTTRSGSSKTGAQYEVKPSRDQIARRAYEIWLANGCPQGQDEYNWLRAETELAGR